MRKTFQNWSAHYVLLAIQHVHEPRPRRCCRNCVIYTDGGSWRRSRRAGHFMVSVRCGHTSYIRCCLATCKCIVLAVTVSALDVSSVRNFQSCCQRQPPFTFSSPWAAVRQPLSAEAVETSGPMHIPIATKGHDNLFVAFAKRKRVDGSTLCSSVGSNTCAPKMEYLVCILAQHSPKKLNEVFSCSPHASWA